MQAACEAPPEPPLQPAAPEMVHDGENLQSLKSISDTVRVDIRKLDELMNLVGELVIQRGALGDIVSRLLSDSKTTRIGSDLSKVYKAFDRKLKGLQASVLDVRMVPLASGLREGFAGTARAPARTRQERPPRNSWCRHRARQVDRRGTRRSADAHGSQRDSTTRSRRRKSVVLRARTPRAVSRSRRSSAGTTS